MIKKRFLPMLALLCLTVSSAWAQGPWTSGDCTLTLSNGTMTVSGNGAMADYGSEEDRPWHDYSSDITSLVVESGVTTIGSRAFYNFMFLTSVTLPEGLTTINVRTFYGCSGLTTLTIPSTVTSINSNDAFFICTSMTDVYLYADPANLTWPEDGDDFKENNATKCHVLAEHLAAYQSNFSDVNVTFMGDLQPQAPTTYTVTLKSGTEDADKWQGKAGEGEYQALPLEGVAAGTAVTVKYDGTKLVKSVKAVKKAAAAAPAVGQVIGSDGKNYDYDSLPVGVTAVAKICYVSGDNGLAIAMADEATGLNWETAISTCAAHTPAITGCTWKLPTKDEWNNMITGAGGNNALFGDTDLNLNTGSWKTYWTSTEIEGDASSAWGYSYTNGWNSVTKTKTFALTRACLAW